MGKFIIRFYPCIGRRHFGFTVRQHLSHRSIFHLPTKLLWPIAVMSCKLLLVRPIYFLKEDVNISLYACVKSSQWQAISSVPPQGTPLDLLLACWNRLLVWEMNICRSTRLWTFGLQLLGKTEAGAMQFIDFSKKLQDYENNNL